jgi:hypothetical protein
MVDSDGRKEFNLSSLLLSYIFKSLLGKTLDLWVVMVSYFSVRVFSLAFTNFDSSSYSSFDLI